MANAEKWTTVMIKRSTKAKLDALQQLFNSLYLKGQLPEQNPSDRFGISMDGVIQILIDRDNSHRNRARLNSESRKGSKRTEKQDGQTDGDAQVLQAQPDHL